MTREEIQAWADMKMSEKRKQDIYNAVYDRFMKLRIELARKDGLTGRSLGEWVDLQVARAMDDAAIAAVKAAEGKP